MDALPPPGIIHHPSPHSVDETLRRLQSLLHDKGVPVFALIDHSGEAERAGLSLRPTKLLIFGNPKAGTPLMLAAPTIALDLPLKLLIWQDATDHVWISYNSLAYLRDRHHLPESLMQNIALVTTLAAQAAE